jgi:hypothetical protein
MTTLHDAIEIGVPAASAWEALKDIRRTHEMFAGVLVASSLDGDVRTVTFANGTVVRERIIGIDDGLKRIAYTVLDRFEYHASSMQIEAIDDGRCRFVWISDFLPDSRAETVGTLMLLGCGALKRVLEER